MLKIPESRNNSRLTEPTDRGFDGDFEPGRSIFVLRRSTLNRSIRNGPDFAQPFRSGLFEVVIGRQSFGDVALHDYAA